MMENSKQLGRALQGMGAWFSGSGPDYERNLLYKQKMEQEQSLLERNQQQELSAERKRAQVLDFADMYVMAKSGNIDGVLGLVGDRKQAIAGFKGESIESDFIENLAMTGQAELLTQELGEFLSLPSVQSAVPEVRSLFADPDAEFNEWKRKKQWELDNPPIAPLEDKPEFDSELEMKLSAAETKMSQGFEKINDSFGRILASTADPSPAGDMALIFAFMKMLDPGSTVREGEYASARDAAGVPARVLAQYNKAVSGEGLAPSQRKDFFERSGKLYNRALSDYDSRISNFKKRISSYPDARVDAIVQDRGIYRGWEKMGDKAPPPITGNLSKEEMTELEELRAWKAGQGAPK